MNLELKLEASWPTLDRLATPKHRTGFIGGSDANIIFGGNRDRIEQLWREKRGEAPTEDLTSVLSVMLGSWTEEFNKQWFERIADTKVSSSGSQLTCDIYSWRRCSLDGYVENRHAVWEAKHTSAFSKSDEILERYMPQLQHNMAVAKSDLAILSVIFGNQKFEIIEEASDWVYQLELLEAELDFWECIKTGRQPIAFAAPAPPLPTGIREVCFEGNNSWAAAADDWARNKDAAKIHAGACSKIKALVEPDVSRAFGHGIEAKRSKSGAISIRELAH